MMPAIQSWTILLIFMAPCIFAENCFVKISGEPQIIKEMISTQGYFCSISVKVLKKENVTDFCDRWALIYEVDGLLEKLKFFTGSTNDINKNHLIATYKSCIVGEDFNVQDAVNTYLQTVDMNPIEILQQVNSSLHKLDGFKADSGSSSECESYYNQNGNNNKDVTKELPRDGRVGKDNASNLQLIVSVIVVVLALLFLCGFLYYRHQYRILKRRLNRSCDLELTRNPGAVLAEEREPLPVIQHDLV